MSKIEGSNSPHGSERLDRLARIVDRATELFGGDAEAARQWLDAPNRALSERTPLEMAETEVGGREVEDLIGRLEHGVVT